MIGIHWRQPGTVVAL